MSGSLRGTPCLKENAWICLILNLEEAHNCKRVMHFLTTFDNGFSGVVEKEPFVHVNKHKWFLGLYKRHGWKTCSMVILTWRFLCDFSIVMVIDQVKIRVLIRYSLQAPSAACLLES